MAIDVNINNQNKHWILIVLEKIKVAVLAIWRFVALIFGTVWSLIVRFCKGVVWLFKKIWKVLVALIVLAGLVLVSIWGYNAYNLKKAVAEIESRFYSDNDSIKIECAYDILQKFDSDYKMRKYLHKYCTEAFEVIESKAYEGNPKCQFWLGRVYYYAFGICTKDDERAVYWMNEAAQQGYVRAYYNMGVAYRYGIGVKVDMRKAIEFLKKGAEAGEAWAQVNYGDLLVEGVTVEKGYLWYETILPKDIEQAKYWWKKAAAQGNEEAKDRLQKIYQ